MLCRKCKKEIENDSIFCRFCGVRQAAERKTKSRANGTGSVFKAPDGRWKAQTVLYYYTDKDGKRKKKTRTQTFDKKSDAIKAAAGPDEGSGSISPTLNGLYELFQTTKRYDKLSDSQKKKLGYAWNKMQPLQFIKISDLTIDRMQEVIDGATKTYYPARDMKVLLSHLFTLAIQRQQETINKSEYIELVDAPKAKREVFTEEDVAKLWDDYNGQYPNGAGEAHELTGYILIMIYTGMRFGELCGIKKVNIHFHEHYMIGGEKTEAGRDREIAISDLIEKVIMHFYDKEKDRLIHKDRWTFYDEYWETLERLGIRHLPPQTCRHTYFTRLAQGHVHPALIAAMGGHAQYETAIDNYNRLPLADKIAAVNKI